MWWRQTNHHLRVLSTQWWSKDFCFPELAACPEAQVQQRWDSSSACSHCPDQTCQHPLFFSTFSPSCSSHTALIISKEYYLLLCLDMKVPVLHTLFSLSSFLCHKSPSSDPVDSKSLHTSLSQDIIERKILESAMGIMGLHYFFVMLLLVRIFWTPPLTSYFCKDFCEA